MLLARVYPHQSPLALFIYLHTRSFLHKIFSAKLSVCLCWAKGAKNKKKVVGQSLMRHETPFGLAACARPTSTQQLDQSVVVVIVMVMGQGKVCQIAEERGSGGGDIHHSDRGGGIKKH